MTTNATGAPTVPPLPEPPPYPPDYDRSDDDYPAPRPAPRLYRSKADRVLGGVCGGLGRYLGIDPVLLRIAFIVLTLGAGSGVLLYIIGWIAIPEVPTAEEGPAPASSRATGRLIVGGAIIVVGVTLLLREALPRFDDRLLWAAALIAVGAFIAWRGRTS